MIGCKEINDYIVGVQKGKICACENVKKLCNNLEQIFKTEKLTIDKVQLKAYLQIGELMMPKLFDWQKFLCALFLCTYDAKGQPRWSNLFGELGRGNGKDGFIAWMSVCMVSKNNPIKNYDVDICANNEEQAVRPVKDVVDWLNKPFGYDKKKRSFHWTIEGVRGLKNGGNIKGRTNNAKGRDGMRSGCVVFNEVHQYADYANIKVFRTGKGKVAHGRELWMTTNGDVRDGVLDDYLKKAESILNSEKEDGGWLFFICCLDDKDEVNDKKMWHKANPSLKYFPNLLKEMENEYRDWLDDPNNNASFMTKRMNIPSRASDKAVCDYEYIKATNKPVPDVKGWSCVVGVDMSRTTDMASVTALFRSGDERYCINHSWVCTHSADWERMKVTDQFPKWQEMGLLTVVDDVEINPRLIADYIANLQCDYNIVKVCCDRARYALFTYCLKEIGITKENHNLKLQSLLDVTSVVPVIESCFLNGNFYWGDNPIMRWCTNNTKVCQWKSRNMDDSDLGQQLYAKIESRSRKTDAFMSLVAAMCVENELPQSIALDFDIGVMTY